MNEYVLLTDSTSDLPKEIVDEFDIKVLPMKFTLDGELHVDDGSVSVDNFYEKVKNKSIVSTSQINPGEFEEYFEKYLLIRVQRCTSCNNKRKSNRLICEKKDISWLFFFYPNSMMPGSKGLSSTYE